MHKHMSLSTRMAFIGIVPTICFACALFWIHSTIRAAHYQNRTEQTRQLVQGAWSVVDYYGTQAGTGNMTMEAAQTAAKTAVRHMSYGSGEGMYYWINDLQPHMVMNALHPELEGKDLSAKKDPGGVYIFREMVKVCQEKGEGTVNYMWPRSDTKQNAPKINYVKLYRPWNWVIGTGIYVDDVERELQALAWIFFGVSGGALLLSLLVGIPVLKSVSRPIERISARLHQGSAHVFTAARQVVAVSQTLTQDSASQVASLEETSAASQEVSAMVDRNAASSEDSAHHMTQTSTMVQEANGGQPETWSHDRIHECDPGLEQQDLENHQSD
jgi:methyl-accepting chemotaxis protein